MKKKAIVLGGGLAGLAAAEKLLDSKKFDVLLLEKASYLGGLASSFQVEGEWIPKFYPTVLVVHQMC